jgi:hypothetical protein
VQRRAEGQEQEWARLERELQRSQAELDRRERAPTCNRREKPEASSPWRRRPILVAGLLLGALIAWFTSLVVALNVLAS